MADYDPSEQDQIIQALCDLMRPVLADGGRKRAEATKPHWTQDEHLDPLHRHLHRYDMGELVDKDSGTHPMAHVMVRAGMIAWQETNKDRC
jgi:hypothetical protein